MDLTEEAARLCQEAEAGDAEDVANAPETDLQVRDAVGVYYAVSRTKWKKSIILRFMAGSTNDDNLKRAATIIVVRCLRNSVALSMGGITCAHTSNFAIISLAR